MLLNTRKRAFFVAIALLAAGGVVLLHRAHRLIPGGPASVSRSRESSAPGRLAALDGSLRAMEDGVRDAPRDGWDPEYVVAHVGRDPGALFRWTQENTTWLPYRGQLRGAIGVLMDREGNSLDRAVLLGTLLTRAGHTVRLAHAELPRDRAAALLPSLVAARLPHATPEATPQPASSADVRTVAAEYHLDGAAVERTLGAQQEALDRLVDTLDQRVSDQASRLLSAVGHPDSGADWPQRYDSALTSLQDHWWVQRQEGAAWIDLDLLAVPDSAGHALAPARETVDIGAVPAALHHEIDVRVVAERWTAGTPTEERVLEATLQPSELIGQPVVLQFWPGDWPSDVILATDDRLKSFRGAALNQQRWSVALVAGASTTRAILLESGKRESGGGGGLGGLGRGIGQGLQSRDDAADPSRSSVLTAVWLEYEIRTPGETPRTIRRTVFDLLGPAARAARTPPLALSDAQRLTRSLALMMRTEILPLPTRFPPAYVQWLTAQSVLANRRLLHAASAGQFEPASTDTLFAPSAPPAGPLVALALARFELSPVADQLYVGHAGLLTRHQGPEVAGGGIAMLDAIDIVANDVDVDLTAPDAFALRLAQGVFETNAEAVLPVVRGHAENAGLASAASDDWVVLTPAGRDDVSRLQVSEDVRALIRRDLEAGNTVVAPRRVVAKDGQGYAAWWRIDPATGITLGMGDRGWGQLVDRAMLTDLAVYMTRSFAWEYALCQAVPQVANDLRFVGTVMEERGWAPSWTRRDQQPVDPVELAKSNNRVCVIQAIMMGYVATAPLVLLTFRYRYGARLAWSFSLKRFLLDQRGGIRIPPKWVRGPIKGVPTEPHGPFAKTQPDLGKTAPDLGKTRPNLGKTQPDLGKTAPEWGKTHVDPAAGPEPAPQPTRPDGPLTREQARENLKQAAEAADAAQAENMRATGEWLQYRINKPNPNPNWFPEDPSIKWDPTVDEALHNEAQRMAQESQEAIAKLREARRAARDAEGAAQGAAGRGGFPPPNPAPAPAPAPNLPGCPPNCGNQNVTVPQQEAQVGPSAGDRMEVGSAGVASSFYPFPWPQ